jgi:hypothetical protein
MPDTAHLRAQESEVETRIIASEYCAAEPQQYVPCDFSERRSIPHVAAGNAMDRCGTQVTVWVDQSRVLVDNVAREVHSDNCYFNNAVIAPREQSGGFDINNRELGVLSRYAGVSC